MQRGLSRYLSATFWVSLMALVALVTVGCHTHPQPQPQPAPSTATGPWPASMQGMASTVLTLIPFIYSQKAYEDSANHAEIQSELRRFSTQAHEIDPKTAEKIVGTDPIERYNLIQLKGDLARASEAFESGSLDYSRGTMKNVFNHCFNCHSLSDAGAKAHWDLSSFRNLSLTPLEKADLLMASRQYDASKDLLEAQLGDAQSSQIAPFDFESALHKYLALMVRVKKDPKATLHQLELLASRKEVPFNVHEHLHSWMQSLRGWSKEKSTNAPLLEQAKRRLKAAHRLQSFAKDHSGDVEYLRVTTLLHEFLKAQQPPQPSAEAFYLLGQSYEVLDELGYWNVHETYYEACIRAVPKTELARNCYRRLQASIYLGFSGSSGLHVPAGEQQRLNDLKSLL
jgi:hypothetical protein